MISVKNLCSLLGVSPAEIPSEILDKTVDRALTDSRSLAFPESTVYFSLRTGTGDGNRYLAHLYKHGVRVFVTDMRPTPALGADAAVLHVPDPLQALQQTAIAIRAKISCPVIGITGSRGKSIAKELLNAILSPGMRVARSPRSWNSQVGVPMSLWEAGRVHNPDVAIFEAGISHTGEMERLARIIRPEIGIFTGLTDEHNRGFESPEQKCRQKALLFRDCHTIYYIEGDALVYDTLRELYPGAQLKGASDLRTLCRAVAEDLGVDAGTAERLSADTAEVSSRIDITDTPENEVVAFDRFTCDCQGIATGLDVVRRRTTARGCDIVALLGDLQHDDGTAQETAKRLSEILLAYGVTTLIAAGRTLSQLTPLLDKRINILDIHSPAEALRYLDASAVFYNALYINGTGKDALQPVYSWLSSRRNVTRMEINLDALAHNYRHYRSILPPETGLVGMVKASAYGCGALEIARTLQSQGADMIAVAVVDEGVALRAGCISLPILVLDPWCENMRAIFAYNLQPTLIDSREDILLTLEEAATAQGIDTIDVHVKIDTGMHRVGLSEDELPQFVEMLGRHPRVRVRSVFSHLATADCLDLDAYTDMQLELFERMSSYLCRHLGYPIRRHVLNTAGITRYGRRNVYELARLGIGLYGITPLDDNDRRNLRPIARLVTRIIATRSYPAGTKVGYGCHGSLDRPSVIGTIPIGYADGIDRRLGNGHASFLVNGVMCPTVGNICMDLCMIDLTDCPDTGDGSVEIFGPSAPIERLSDTLGTIPYEVLARISPRVKRLYFRE